MRKSTIRDYLWDVMNDRAPGLKGGAVSLLLKGCSIFYKLAVIVMRWLYQRRVLSSHKLGRPVICIGNITVGGTGKTPVVQWVVSALKADGLNPVVLTRGYMARSQSAAGSVLSDEAVLLSESLGVPVIVDKDRRRGAAKAIREFEVDVFVMDDGFQHWRVKRDLDIVVINSANPFGNGEVLPRGILREPLSALGRAGYFILNKADVAEDHGKKTKGFLKEKFPHIPLVVAGYSISEYQDLQGRHLHLSEEQLRQPAFVVCSIGDPESFRRKLLDQRVQVTGFHDYPDHCVFSGQDVDDICKEVKRSGTGRVFMTHKDAVKLRAFHRQFQEKQIECCVVFIRVGIEDGKEELISRIRRACSA